MLQPANCVDHVVQGTRCSAGSDGGRARRLRIRIDRLRLPARLGTGPVRRREPVSDRPGRPGEIAGTREFQGDLHGPCQFHRDEPIMLRCSIADGEPRARCNGSSFEKPLCRLRLMRRLLATSSGSCRWVYAARPTESGRQGRLVENCGTAVPAAPSGLAGRAGPSIERVWTRRMLMAAASLPRPLRYLQPSSSGVGAGSDGDARSQPRYFQRFGPERRSAPAWQRYGGFSETSLVCGPFDRSRRAGVNPR
jgi:hypothetical protein